MPSRIFYVGCCVCLSVVSVPTAFAQNQGYSFRPSTFEEASKPARSLTRSMKKKKRSLVADLKKVPLPVKKPTMPKTLADEDAPETTASVSSFSTEVLSHPTILDISDEAVANSRAVDAARAKEKETKAEIYRAVSNFLPKAEGRLEANDNKYRNTNEHGRTKADYYENTVTFSGSMDVFNGGRNIYGLKQARANNKASRQSTRETSSRVQIETAQAFYSLLRDRRMERHLHVSVGSMNEILHMTRMRYKAGDASKTDIALARSQLATLESELLNASASKKSAEITLRHLLGHAGTDELTEISTKTLPFSLAEGMDKIAAQNPSILMAFYQSDAQKHGVDMALSELMPKLSLTGEIEKVYQRGNIETDERNVQLGLQLRMPLFNAGMLAGVKASHYKAKSTYYSALDTKRQVMRQFEIDWNGYEMAKQQKAALGNKVSALHQALRGMKEEYKIGLRSLIDVLTSQIELIKGQLLIEQAKFQQQILYHRIMIAAGHRI